MCPFATLCLCGNTISHYHKKKPRQSVEAHFNYMNSVLATPLQAPNKVCMPPPTVIYYCFLHYVANMRIEFDYSKYFYQNAFYPFASFSCCAIISFIKASTLDENSFRLSAYSMVVFIKSSLLPISYLLPSKVCE